MSRPHDGSKYLANVRPRSAKHLCIQWTTVYGGTTATGWYSFNREGKEED